MTGSDLTGSDLTGSEAAAAPARHGVAGDRGAWLLWVLVAFYVLNAFDRTIMSLMVGPIRRDMAVSDSQLGFMLGMGFALFYGAFGIPFGSLSDRYSRRLILWGGVSLWSAATIACGVADDFGQLLAARMVLGIGEAALAPAAMSMIGDRFPPDRLARAMSIFLAGGLIGNSAAIGLGGFMVAHFDTTATVVLPVLGSIRGWQMPFVLIGTAGLLVAPVAFTLREPRARLRTKAVSSVLGALWQRRSVLLSFAGSFVLASLLIYACNLWVPTYLIRRFHWTVAEAGITLGLINLVGAAGGTYLAGYLCDALLKAGYRDAHLRFFLFAIVLAAPAGIAAFLVTDGVAFVVLFALFSTLGLSFGGCALAAVQAIAPADCRSRFAAAYATAVIVVGAGLGPWMVGVLTQHVFADDAKLGYSLLVLLGICLPIAIVSAALGLAPLRRTVACASRTPG